MVCSCEDFTMLYQVKMLFFPPRIDKNCLLIFSDSSILVSEFSCKLFHILKYFLLSRNLQEWPGMFTSRKIPPVAESIPYITSIWFRDEGVPQMMRPTSAVYVPYYGKSSTCVVLLQKELQIFMFVIVVTTSWQRIQKEIK